MKQDYESELKKGKSVKESTLLQVSDNISDFSTYSSGSCAPFDIDCVRYSTVTKAVRVTTYVLRFIKMIRKSVGVNQVKTDSKSKYLTNNELTEAENLWLLYIQGKHFSEVFTAITKKKVREKSRECHNHKPQPFPDLKRKRKPTNLNKHKPNKCTKSTKISSLFPKRGNRNTKRTEKHKNKMTHGKTYNKLPRRIKLITIINKDEYSWLILLYARVNENQ